MSYKIKDDCVCVSTSEFAIIYTLVFVFGGIVVVISCNEKMHDYILLKFILWTSCLFVVLANSIYAIRYIASWKVTWEYIHWKTLTGKERLFKWKDISKVCIKFTNIRLYVGDSCISIENYFLGIKEKSHLIAWVALAMKMQNDCQPVYEYVEIGKEKKEILEKDDALCHLLAISWKQAYLQKLFQKRMTGF